MPNLQYMTKGVERKWKQSCRKRFAGDKRQPHCGPQIETLWGGSSSLKDDDHEDYDNDDDDDDEGDDDGNENSITFLATTRIGKLLRYDVLLTKEQTK